MAQGVVKVIEKNASAWVGSGNVYLYIQLQATETYDPEVGTSTLAFRNLKAKVGGVVTTGVTGYIDGKILLKKGSTVIATVMSATSASGTYQVYLDSTTFQNIKVGTTNWGKDVTGITHDADGTAEVTVEFVNFHVYSTSSSIGDANINASETFALTKLPGKYTLSLSVGAHSSGTVTLNSSAYRTEGIALTNGARIYSGEKVKVVFSASSGYEASCTVNGTSRSSGYIATVSGNVAVAVTAKAQGNAYINGDLHQTYIYTGGAWALYVPYIWTGSAWEIH